MIVGAMGVTKNNDLPHGNSVIMLIERRLQLAG